MAKQGKFWGRARRWGIPAVCVLAGAALGAGAMAWQKNDAAASTGSPTASQAAQTATASLETIEKSVSATGTLAAALSETEAFEASGKVLAVNVAVGDTVAKGDVLATIDSLQLTADLRSAQAALAQSEANVVDLEDAADGSDSSDAQIASAKADVKVKKQSVADAKADMDNAELVAPFDGLVTAQSYAVGDAVGSASGGGGATTGQTSGTSTTTAGITIVGQNDWAVTADLTADEVALIKVGDQVNFTADNVDAFFGLVTDVSQLPTTSSGSATYPVTLQVTGTPTGLFEGISVTADIVYVRKTDVLTVPTNAITTADGVSTVTVVAEDGTETETTVTLGDSSGDLTEITDGLSEGDSVKVTVFSQGNSNTGTGDQQQFPGNGQFPGGGQFPSGGQFPGGQGGAQGSNG